MQQALLRVRPQTVSLQAPGGFHGRYDSQSNCRRAAFANSHRDRAISETIVSRRIVRERVVGARFNLLKRVCRVLSRRNGGQA